MWRIRDKLKIFCIRQYGKIDIWKENKHRMEERHQNTTHKLLSSINTQGKESCKPTETMEVKEAEIDQQVL